MVDSEVLALVAVVELVLLAAILLVLIYRSAGVALRGPRRDRRIAAAADDLIVALDSGQVPSSFAQLRRPEQVEAVFALAPSLSGEAKARLTALARDSGLLEWARSWSGSRRWYVRLRGAELLGVLGEYGEVAGLLDDARPEVRTRAVRWVAVGTDPETMKTLCRILGDPDPGVRFTVLDSLLRVGSAVVEPLRDVIASDPDARTTAAALRVAAGIGDHRLAELAIEYTHDGRAGVRAAAVAACATVGGPVATARLVSLLKEPEPEVREEAVRSLSRINAWTSSPALAELLADPVWSVRRAAAVALGELGPVGRLYVRRTSRQDAGIASAIATQALGPGREAVA